MTYTEYSQVQKFVKNKPLGLFKNETCTKLISTQVSAHINAYVYENVLLPIYLDIFLSADTY